MSTKRVMVCDECGNEVDLNDMKKPWTHLATVVVDAEMLQDLLRDVDPDDEQAVKRATDAGDFCSLVCLANWASTQANLRSLDG